MKRIIRIGTAFIVISIVSVCDRKSAFQNAYQEYFKKAGENEIALEKARDGKEAAALIIKWAQEMASSEDKFLQLKQTATEAELKEFRLKDVELAERYLKAIAAAGMKFQDSPELKKILKKSSTSTEPSDCSKLIAKFDECNTKCARGDYGYPQAEVAMPTYCSGTCGPPLHCYK